jgi:carbonic anhydrase
LQVDEADILAHGDELAFELAAIRSSLANLRTFPFIAEREGAELLELHGLHFDIATGTVMALDEASGKFVTMEELCPS